MKIFRWLVSVLLFSVSAASIAHGLPYPRRYTVGVPIIFHNGDTHSFTPRKNPGKSIVNPVRYDVVVIGAGLAGMSASLYLSDAGKHVLLVEKEADVGGVASWGQDSDSKYDRGAAYWTEPYEEEVAILTRIGLGDYEKANPILEPTDSYYVRGQYYAGIWEEENMQKLPSSFALFKFEMQRLVDENTIPNQPIEEAAQYGTSLELDKINSRQWIESMPSALEKFLSDNPSAKNFAKGQEILGRYKREFGSNPKGMEGVVELMDLYCRSALGGNSDDISAVALANFYGSEIITRYTSNLGTGLAIKNMFDELKTKPKTFSYQTHAAVTMIRNTADGVDVTYNFGRKSYLVHARYAVFSSQLNLAPTLIKDFKKKAPDQAAVIESVAFTHYAVQNVHVDGQPYRAAYDTWTRPDDYTIDDFTDVILGHWMDPRMVGYVGYRDFKKDPPIPDGVLSIYHGLPPKWSATNFSKADAEEIAIRDTERLGELYTKLPSTLWQGPFKVTSIETNRWPISIHTVAPGYFTDKVRIMRRPFGRVYFAHSNLGTPAIEEALFRGHCAADNILKKMDPNFEFEKWTRCPLEK